MESKVKHELENTYAYNFRLRSRRL